MKRKDFHHYFLEEFIYRLNYNNPFMLELPLLKWAAPCVGFAYDNSRPTKVLDRLKEDGIINNPRESVIAVLADWDHVAEGIFFTDTAIVVNSPKNKMKKFRISYYNIKSLNYYWYDEKQPEVEILSHSNKKYIINTDLFSKLNIKIALEAAVGSFNFTNSEKNRVWNIRLNTLANKSMGEAISGTIMGNAGAANNVWRMETFTIPGTGHGFAAERMNHLYDILHGSEAEIVGNDNEKNGADRRVDGVNIQSKYCRTGEACVEACFDKNGNFRYINKNGTVMEIEVPSDKYDEAVAAMAQKIREGKVPGHTNPADAKKIIKKGNFTYQQAQRVAEAGTVESLTFDAVNGAIICASAFGVTALLTFATSVWSGEDFKSSLKRASYAGLQVGGVAFATTVLSSQLARVGGLEVAGKVSGKLVELMGPKAAATLANALRSNAPNIYGAAASKHVAKMLKGNILTGAVSLVVLSAGDIINIFEGRISGGQLVKNVSSTAGGIGGGYAGFGAGAELGTLVCPGIGTAIGGFLGACFFGNLGQKAANGLVGLVIDDDSKEVISIIEKELVKLGEEYLLNAYEVENVCENFGADITNSMIKDIYEKYNREAYVDQLLSKYINYELEYRPKIRLTNNAMENAMVSVLKELSDDNEIDDYQTCRNNASMSSIMNRKSTEDDYKKELYSEYNRTLQGKNNYNNYYTDAIHGDYEAMYKLGLICEHNESIQEALAWYEKAAEHGISGAQHRINQLNKKINRQDYEKTLDDYGAMV